MLLTFSVGNFLSFKDVQTLNMEADSLKELQSNIHIPYFYNTDLRLLKSVAIYGHNSHGKSNYLKAFQFFQNLIFTSFTRGQQSNKINNLEPFRLNTSMSDKPSYFEISFLIKDIKYRYKLIATSSTIIKEELLYAQSKIRENYLFERDGQDIKFNKQWNKDNSSRGDILTQFARPHILLLSVLLSQQGLTNISEIEIWLSNNMVVPDIYINELAKAQAIYSDPEYTSLILKLINDADLGFTSVFDKIDKLSKSTNQYEKGFLNVVFEKKIKDFELYTNHAVYDKDYKIVDNVEFELLKNESSGSIKYFIVVCLLAYAIKKSQLIWIDELDARFHPMLLDMLIGSFHNPDINATSAQLIFTTHNTQLLDHNMRRDQMVVVDKNEWGESTIRRAHTVENPIRIGKSLEKEYRKGKLGGHSKKIKNNNLGPSLFD